MASPPPRPSAHEIALHSPWMRRLARGLVGDGAAADDLVQDAWAKLAGRGAVREGYLAAVVRSLALSRHRGERRRARREAAAARPEALPSAAVVAARIDVARRVAEALEELDEPYRTTLVLRYYDDLSSAEIARRAGVPAATVRTRLKRGLALLRGRLDERAGGRASWVSALLPLARPPAGAALAAPLALLLVMKLALGTLAAAGALALVWTLVARDGADPTLAPLAEGGASALDAPLAEVAERDDDAATARIEAPQADPVVERDPLAAAREGGSVRARALTGEGRPIPGAWLGLRLLDAPPVQAGDDGRLAMEVDPAALERLAGLDVAGNRRVGVQVGAAGRATRTVRGALPERETVLELGDVVLAPGAVLHGRVVDGNGMAVEGARVAFGKPVDAEPGQHELALRGPRDLDPAPWTGEVPAVVGTSGLGGAFRLDGLPAGHGTAWARTATSLWAYSEPIGLRAGEELGGIELVVRDAPQAVISGVVVDPEGAPLPGVTLSFRTDESQGWFEERTDARGRFWFAPRDGAAQDVTARSPSLEWEDQVRRAVDPGTLDLVIAFERSSWLHVEVRDPGGAAVGGGLVTGLPGEGPTDHALPRGEAPLDSQGRARLRRPDGPFRVRVEGWGYRAVLLGPFDPALVPDPLEVTLEPVPALVGQVLLPDGSPAAGARVSLHQGASRARGAVQVGNESIPVERRHLSHQGWNGDREAFVYELMFEPEAAVEADGSGHFRLPLPGVDASAAGEVSRPEGGLGGFGPLGPSSQRIARAKPDLPWYVHAAVGGQASATSGPHLFDPTEDAELELRLPQGGAIAGRLVLEDGASPLGWTVYASDALAEVAQSPVGADGAFQLAALHPGPWQVRAFEPGQVYSRGGGRMRTERVPEPDVEVLAGRTVELEHVTRARASARLRGRLWVDGAPPGARQVTVRTSTPQAAITSYSTTLDPDGRFELTLEPGLSTWLGIFMSEGSGIRLTTHVTVAPGDNDWAFDYETARLEGWVDPGGLPESPFGSVGYEVERDGVELATRLRPEADGRFGPVVVPAGAGILRGPARGFTDPGETWAQLELEPGEARVLDLR